MTDIHAIAAQFDRLAPEQVDTSEAGNGQQDSGHIGFADTGIIGWYCNGGNMGEPLCTIPEDDMESVHDRLEAAKPGDGTLDEIIRQYAGVNV